MKLLEWNNEKMNLGIEIIDNQHKKLLKIINSLYSAIENNTQYNDIYFIIEELENYVQYHFKTEENLVAHITHDDITSHKEEHGTFSSKILMIKETLQKDKNIMHSFSIKTLSNLFYYLSEWFINHVIYSDKVLLSHLVEKDS